MPRFKTSIALISGGLDSAVAAAIAKTESNQVVALSFNYNQRHKVELEAAMKIAERYAVKHVIVPLSLDFISNSALTSKDIAVPENRALDDMLSSIPVTYVPSRNIIFLSIATALADVENADAIYMGINAVDYSGYPDCRPEFVTSFQRMIDKSTRRGVAGASIAIKAPLVMLSKADIIKKGAELNVPFELTHSCYNPSDEGLACGLCDSCLIRRKGFQQAGVADPTRYANLQQ
ncbi:7-cyano-7-deazaguanine synthase QueC [candidate division WWE3 bacterium]|uniref:7-cyano-7-deazaguanine synthase n=1 Tax=candidate division WWE3 bacterium TaxID=2053526 RepID=A0A3A4ZEK6_UNCKA|nr:MAG: 7-cyano-7-deazaguanine synthase QueC [candidate division WWE3 bacterium]